jgi:ribosomal protein S18 acetylase RimI-like enzyme
MHATIREVTAHTDDYADLVSVAEQLDQARYIPAREAYAEQSILLGAFIHKQCVGFLRFLILTIGRDHNRPPIVDARGQPLREGYVEAFGVLSPYRRQRIGQALQAHAIAYCRQQECYQIRSHSPVSSVENYALKLKMGYAIHPSHENDSYYFIKTLQRDSRTAEPHEMSGAQM